MLPSARRRRASRSRKLTPSLNLGRAAWDRAHLARAAGELRTALQWLDRAHRLLPQDDLVALTLGGLLLELGHADAARRHLERVDRAAPTAESALLLVACYLALNLIDECVAALTRALQSSVATTALTGLAERVVTRFGLQGWCAVDRDGRVRSGSRRPMRVALDSRLVDGEALPEDWWRGHVIEVEGDRGSFLGSPLPVDALCAVSGFVEARMGGLEGWAYHPADLDRDPVLVLRGSNGTKSLQLDIMAEDLADLPPLARPRRLALVASEIVALGAPIHVTDARGRPLLGSPIGIELVAATALPSMPAIDLCARAADVIVPVYRGFETTLACLASVLETVTAGSVVHVIDDASPEPALVHALRDMAKAGLICLHQHAENKGFPAAVNLGMRLAPGRDVVLLNSDTLVPPGWLERLRGAAYSAPEVGTATPFSNNAAILSYRIGHGSQSMPGLDETISMDRVAQAANAGLAEEVPVGVGFCLYIRRDCLVQVGEFRDDVFAQGYGEENDFCLRAATAGWRHVAALDVFVSHRGSASFGGAGAHLLRRNTSLLNRLHPGYGAEITLFVADDRLFGARRRMDAIRWREADRCEASIVLVTHGGGGGVAELVERRAAAFRREGVRPIVLDPVDGGCRVDRMTDLRFSIPAELPDLASLLRASGVQRIEVHHLLGHDHRLLDLADQLGVDFDFWIHDDAAFCQRIALIGPERRYCGEPPIEGCQRCIDILGSRLQEVISVAALVQRSTAAMARARRVVVPTMDGARRVERHFPSITVEVMGWENDSDRPAVSISAPAERTRVCVAGAIGIEKGYEVLLACARDVQMRRLPLDFVLCGVAVDEAPLLEAGVLVTGRYEAVEAVDLIRAQRAHLAFLPSIWPETWCFVLSHLWNAGLFAVAFDLGAQAARIRATGLGALLPLGLGPSAINESLLRLAPTMPAWHRLQP